LKDLVKRKETIFGGTFFPPTLKSYRWEGAGTWSSCARMSLAERELISLQLLQKAILGQFLNEFEKKPSGAGFALWYDAFLSFFPKCTRGLFPTTVSSAPWIA